MRQQFGSETISTKWLRLSIGLTVFSLPAFADHNPQCTIDGYEGHDLDVSQAVHDQLTPRGSLEVGVNYGNPNNAHRDPDTGLLSGVAIDLACVLADRLDVDVNFFGYPGIPPQLDAFRAGVFDLGFSFLPGMEPEGVATAHAHLGVENTYTVLRDSLFQSVDDVDRPGIRISVARDNCPDLYLTAHLQSAELVRFETVPQAEAALRDGQVEAFAGSRTAALDIPEGRALPDNFTICNLAMFLPLERPDGIPYLSNFVETAKQSGLIADAIDRAGLVGVTVPPPECGNSNDK